MIHWLYGILNVNKQHNPIPCFLTQYYPSSYTNFHVRVIRSTRKQAYWLHVNTFIPKLKTSSLTLYCFRILSCCYDTCTYYIMFTNRLLARSYPKTLGLSTVYWERSRVYCCIGHSYRYHRNRWPYCLGN